MSKRLFKIGSTTNKNSRDLGCNVMVIGAENVGKTGEFMKTFRFHTQTKRKPFFLMILYCVAFEHKLPIFDDFSEE